MPENERYSGYSKIDLVRDRQKRMAVKIRAVEEHSDFDYREVITSCLKLDSAKPLTVIMDEMGRRLPRLASTSIDDYFLNGTYVDKVRTARILATLTDEGKAVVIEDNGIRAFMSKEQE